MTTEASTKAPKPKTEFIVISETIFKSWARDASTFALFAGLIGVGILAESSAMQWAGFFVAIVTLISRAGGLKVKRMTRDQAVAYLQTREDA